MTGTREYIVTARDNNVVARIRGKNRPALSTLYKHFCAEYGLNDEIKGSIPQAIQIARDVHRQYAAGKKLLEEGYTGHFLSENFVEWLVRRHGFEVIDTELFSVDWT